jgi:glyoxylase-like metal-dependent hydrolase (beta-lactamase superfamily II)
VVAVTAWDEVGDRCYRRRYAAFDLNIGVVRGSDGLLVIDTRADLRQAEELLDDLRAFAAPVRWVVNSHWHFDHTFGNQRFVERSRDDAVDAARPAAAVASDLELWGHVDLPPMLLGNEAGLRRALREAYGDEAGDEYDRVVLTPPDHLVEHHHVLDLGDRGVELAHTGRGHTSNDLVAIVADAGLVFAGDLLEESSPPAYGHDCYPLDWPVTVAALLHHSAITYVPGHGDAMSAAAACEQWAALVAVADTIHELWRAGVDVGDALAEGRERWPFPVDVVAEAVRRGYEHLDDPRPTWA